MVKGCVRTVLALMSLAILLVCADLTPAAEWTHIVPAGIPGEIRNNSSFELFVPDSIPADQAVRGLLAVFDYEGGAEMYDDPQVREWAAREGMGILRHQIRNTSNQFTIAKTQGAVDIMFNSALPALATSSGRLEIAHTSLIWTGLSQAGWASIELANLSESRTIAALPIHESTGARNPALGGSLAGLSVPTLHVIGGNDNVNMGTLSNNTLYAQTIIDFAEERRSNGGLNAIAVQRNSGHTDWDGRADADLDFMLDWMSAVIDLRVPGVIPTNVPYALHTFPESSGRLGSLDLAYNQGSPFVSVTSASIEPYSAPGARDKWWLPEPVIAEAWRDYNATGSYVLIPEPASASLLLMMSGFVLLRRQAWAR